MTRTQRKLEQPIRIGAVSYLNSKPLVAGLQSTSPLVELRFDLPSRLADSLAAHRLDVALVPSIELFRHPGYRIVSDACVACRGPVLSVKLLFRKPPAETRSLALDEGSRTSAALARILLDELHGVRPNLELLPIGASAGETNADAVLLIGDRAMQPISGSFVEAWDLGDLWCCWAGRPMVFAMWVARAGVDLRAIAPLLSAARDEGVAQIDRVAVRECGRLNISPATAESYLRDNLHFFLGEQEEQGLRRFYALCAQRGFVPPGLDSTINCFRADGCPTS